MNQSTKETIKKILKIVAFTLLTLLIILVLLIFKGRNDFQNSGLADPIPKLIIRETPDANSNQTDSSLK